MHILTFPRHAGFSSAFRRTAAKFIFACHETGDRRGTGGGGGLTPSRTFFAFAQRGTFCLAFPLFYISFSSMGLHGGGAVLAFGSGASRDVSGAAPLLKKVYWCV